MIALEWKVYIANGLHFMVVFSQCSAVHCVLSFYMYSTICVNTSIRDLIDYVGMTRMRNRCNTYAKHIT